MRVTFFVNPASSSVPDTISPVRGTLSVAVLLALELAVTSQLITGFAMMAHPDGALLTAHIAGGMRPSC